MRLGLALVLMLGAFLAGLWSGHDLAEGAADAQRSREIARQFDRYAEQVAQGEEAVTALQGSLGNLASYHQTSMQRMRDAPLVVGRAGAGACVPAGAQVRAAPDHLAAAPPAPESAAAPEPAAGAEPGLRLTAAAVSLWNSALVGADVSAGACGPDDTAAAACAADSGLTLRDAWANHGINAANCAADRARHAQLIDYLKAR